MAEYRSINATTAHPGRHRALRQPSRILALIRRVMTVGLNSDGY